MSHLKEEGDRLYRHIRLDWYVLVTKTGQDGYRTGKGCLQNRYSDRYRDRQSDIKLLHTCVPLSSARQVTAGLDSAWLTTLKKHVSWL